MMELQDKIFTMIDEELAKLESEVDKLRKENTEIKENIENKEMFLQQLEVLNEEMCKYN